MIWLGILGLYTITISLLMVGMRRVKKYHYQEPLDPVGFSIIIPCRDEAFRIVALLESCLQLDYKQHLFELLFIDDFSSDKTVDIIHQHLRNSGIRYAVFQNTQHEGSPKKQAITLGVAKASFTWILSTDADCRVPKLWLKSLASCIEEQQPRMIVGPVNYSPSNTFLASFQHLHFISLQATNMGLFGFHRPIMSNGANLAYLKEDFLTLNGYSGNTHITSGDDVFLFEKFQQTYPKSVQYLKNKNAIVTTFPVATWSGFIQQSIRWAGKTGASNSMLSKGLGLLVVLMNMVVLVGIVSSILDTENLQHLGIVLGTKLGVDFLFFLSAFQFFDPPKYRVLYIIASSVVYPIYAIVTAVLIPFSSYTWKGRIFKK